MDIQNLRWWGWGTLDQDYSLEGRPAFWPMLREQLELPAEAIEHETPPIPLEEISLRPPRFGDPELSSLRKLLGEEAVRTDRLARAEHAYGQAYRDLLRIRAGHIPHPPDVVAYPADEAQIASLLSWAADHDVAVIPFGGGSSVLGGVEPEPDDRPTITLDLARLDRMLAVDPVSRTARLQAGATGPEVEAQLNARGFTLGHFPQSFEFSTLGGWIATRSAGQNSIGYGKIEHMTQAVRTITPAGIVETRDTPATAAGPSLLQLLVGSEGTYGVITEATMRIHPLPAVRDYRGILFHGLENGVAAFRDLMQSSRLHPAIIRLSDAPETAASVALSHEHHGLRRLADKLVEWYLKTAGYDLTTGSTVMMLGFDGDTEWTAQQWDLALEICGDHRGLSLGRSVGRSWIRDRYAQPYLRDTLLGHGIMVDTLETATSWSNLTHLYETMVRAMKESITATGGGPGYVMTHISHAYKHGASLYSTFLGRQVSDPDSLVRQAQWQAVKKATTDAIVAAGGTLTHHHGIGRDHAPWLEEEVGPLGVQMLDTIRQTLDPAGIMNPGILLPGKGDGGHD
ncbi:MAG: FAD-binding oxidoreductase [Chloroflexota bacterium]|nr:FAD-binding oxidoreductase [Chloroflexota bacterium]